MGGKADLEAATSNREHDMTPRIPENSPAWLIDRNLVTVMGDAPPPRDPNDDDDDDVEDEDDDAEREDNREPAVIREPDEDE
jgi:hypothetical protein